MKFKIGDRVKATYGFPIGRCGKVIEIDSVWFLVDFDDWFGGHNGNRDIRPSKNNSGYYLQEDGLEPETKETPTFKVGDIVKHKKTGRIDEVESVPGMIDYDSRGFGKAEEGFLLKSGNWSFQDEWEKSDLDYNPKDEVVKEDVAFKKEEPKLHLRYNPLAEQLESYTYSGDYKPFSVQESIVTLINSSTEVKEKPMNSIFQAIKAKLSPTDRVLVKNGYLNSDGSRTSMYESELLKVANQKLIEAEDTADFRKALAKELKEDD